MICQKSAVYKTGSHCLPSVEHKVTYLKLCIYFIAIIASKLYSGCTCMWVFSKQTSAVQGNISVAQCELQYLNY